MSCFVITTYCNTPKKVEELKKCIHNLKQFNIDILIHAHFPLNLDIQKSVKYYIYDSTNPIITDGTKQILRWKWYVTAFKMLTIPKYDYSYCVMSQWNSSIKFLKGLGYQQIHIINYDTFINASVFKKHQEYLKENNGVFEYYSTINPRDNTGNLVNEELIYLAFLSIQKDFFDILTDNLTLKKYMASIDTMLETYIMELVNNSTFKIKKSYSSLQVSKFHEGDFDIYTTIENFDDFDFLKKVENNLDLYYVFGGRNTEFEVFEIIIFEITKPLKEIIIDINGDVVKVNNITEKYYSLITEYTMQEIINIIDNSKLNIIIDGDVVSKDIIEKMKFQIIAPRYE